jgi:exodeoxyribonuclease V beta subunit
VAQPHQEQGVRAALVTDLMGLSGEDLYRMAQDEREWEERLEAFHSYHDLWRESGFIRMFRAFLAKEDVFRRLLGFRDGERRLTNLLHLAELLQARTSQAHVGMAGLIKWLAERRRSRPSAEEEQQLRLESDEHLVKIVTVHKSKGLEYPVVFCPFLWDGKLWSAKADIISFHDLNDPDYPVLDIGSPHQEQHRDYAHHEEAAENLRLLYVALTRAKQLCYLVWGNIQEAGTSAPAWLLHPPLDFDGRHADPQASDYDRLLAAARRVQTLGGQAMREELELLAQRAPQTVQISSLPVEGELRPPRQLARGTPQLGARRFRRAIGGGWQITSFTALTLGKGGEGPDYEEIADALEELPQTPAEEQAVSGFPRGAQAGACLHTLLERMDFSQRNRARLESLVKETLEEYGFGTECSDSALEMIERVLATPLEEGGPCLRQVSLKRRLSELEFHYPLAGLTPTGLQRVLYAHGFGSGAFRDAIDKLDFSFSRGYLKGYIDLVFEAGGRFYLVDYKSNCLGMDPGAYRAELLAEVMASEAYYLQYLIYTVALHRYLRRRLHGYDYERHFGAVYYLFLRGMDPTLGSSHGIYRDRPSESLVRALDSYLASAGSG